MDSTTPTPPRVAYKVGEVARMLGVRTETVHKWCDAGTVRSVRLSERVRLIPATELERLIGGDR